MLDDRGRVVAWFSCGAASAVAAKLAREACGDRCEVVYCDTMASEHPDNARFFREVSAWIGTPIRVIRSEKYPSIDSVFERRKYMSGVSGAICTTELKKIPREAYQRPADIHVFGYTVEERRRADTFERNNPSLDCEWLLIDREITKAECKARLAAAGIALPEMYSLGFDHNNCLGCVKSASPGYWNRVRRLFPEVFKRRSEQCRAIGARLVKIGGERRFIDEIPLDADSPDDDIECGPICAAPRQLRLPGTG